MTKHKAYGPYEKYIKRPQDFVCALLAIIVLSPVLLVVAILVRANLGAPVLFTQERPGRDGKIFKLYKFRSMLPPKDGVIDPNEDAKRLTPFGRKLRATPRQRLTERIGTTLRYRPGITKSLPESQPRNRPPTLPESRLTTENSSAPPRFSGGIPDNCPDTLSATLK